jgi:orotidine-5'-phosphate decarboxylase
MAIKNGASHVVVGRPITRAVDPIQVITQMQQDIIASAQ